MALKALVVEDDVALRDILIYHLRREDFTVFASANGYEAVQIARREQPDVVLLDVMLEGLNGLSVCRQLKGDAVQSGPAIMMMSARTEEEDVVAGLREGADDYVRKPFNLKEVVARIRTLLRRASPAANASPGGDVLRFPPVVLDHGRHEVTLNGTPLALTATEYRLLHLLMGSPERVFSRSQLLAQISDHKADISGRNIDVHIRSLRRKLGDHAALIDTARGVGYRFSPSSIVTA